jgi:hypothetical protein
LLVFQPYLDLILLLDCCIQFDNLNGFLLLNRFGRLGILGDFSETLLCNLGEVFNSGADVALFLLKLVEQVHVRAFDCLGSQVWQVRDS